MDKLELIDLLWEIEPRMQRDLAESDTIQQARNRLFNYLNELDRTYFNIYADSRLTKLHDLEKKHAKWCVRVFKNIIRSENERLAHGSALTSLWKIAHKRSSAISDVREGFLCEMIFLTLGINGKFAFYRRHRDPATGFDPYRSAGEHRSMVLDR